MKKITAKHLAMSYTGVFLGAGFVSGQELWQFFACFGPVGLLGFLGTAALFFYINYANLRMIQVTGVEDMGRLMTRGEKPALRAVVTFMQCLLLFGVSVIIPFCVRSKHQHTLNPKHTSVSTTTWTHGHCSR